MDAQKNLTIAAALADVLCNDLAKFAHEEDGQAMLTLAECIKDRIETALAWGRIEKAASQPAE
jgi:hypothetical protein